MGDRGLITSARIDQELKPAGIDWITALRAPAIQTLADDDGPLSLFDDRDMAEIASPDYPGERLIVCRNPAPPRRRSISRATWRRSPARRRSTASMFCAPRCRKGISMPARPASANKSLAHVERAFRSLKSIDLEVRPVHHRLAGRVRAHVFLCMLAYYVAWHLRRTLAPLLFEDHDRMAAAPRASPVAPAEVSPAARAKVRARKTEDGEPVHSFRALLPDLATLTRNTVPFGDNLPMTVLSRRTPLQQRAFDLLGVASAP